MKLIMVHGRSQEGKDPEGLKKEWLDSLVYGCARANVKLPENLIVEFPFYGDELADMIQRLNEPLAQGVTLKGVITDNENYLRGELIQEIANNAGISERDVLLELGYPPLQRSPENWEWVQGIIRAIDRIPGLNSRFIDGFTRDVYIYLTNPNVRREIDKIVAEILGDGPCVIIGHSLGSIITYNVLRTRQASPGYPRLVTVGSPLGVRAIQQELTKPLVSPPCISHWFNAYDDRDLVALKPLDQVNFNITPKIENYDKVKNFTDNRHGITGYLSDPEVARKIVEFL